MVMYQPLKAYLTIIMVPWVSERTINDWNVDASYTTGGNTQTYKVNQTHNRNEVYSPSTWIDLNNNGEVDAGEFTEGSVRVIQS